MFGVGCVNEMGVSKVVLKGVRKSPGCWLTVLADDSDPTEQVKSELEDKQTRKEHLSGQH